MLKQLHYGIYSLRGENNEIPEKPIGHLSKLYHISKRNDEV